MASARDERLEQLRDDIERVTVLVKLAVPAVLAVVALFLPMFRHRGVDDEDFAVPDEEATLLGIVFDPGSTGPTTAIVITALIVVVGLIVSASSIVYWVPERTGWSGTVMYVAAGVTLAASFVLWVLTHENDDTGRFGTESIDPTMQLLLAFVVPIWFFAARSRPSR